MENLPAYVDIEALDEFVSMRRAIKKPLTPRAMTRLIHRLEALKAAGHCPNAALIQSADHYWQDVYPAKDMSITPVAAVQSRDWLDEQEQARKAAVKPPAEILRMVRRA